MEEQRQNRRLVIFAGPHKSASSSLQEFFVQYAAGRRKYHNLMAFQRWRWPLVNSERTLRIPERKIFSRLVMNHTKKGGGGGQDEALSMQVREDIRSAIYNTWTEKQRIMVKPTKSTSDKDDGGKHKLIMTEGYVNLILASEEFDRFGPTPFSGRDGMGAIRDIVELIQPPQLDIVVNYRTPRHKHWLSIWKQLTAIQSRTDTKEETGKKNIGKVPGKDGTDDEQKVGRRKASYKNFICSSDRVWEYLDCVSNPLGLVAALRSNQWNVTLIDMGGVEERNLDISHASSCHVLNVPCTEDGWVRGIVNHTLEMNTKSRSLDLSEQDLDEMEWLLRKRDCAYASIMRSDPHVSLLFRQTLWKDCNVKAEQHIYRDLLNTTFMMQLLQAQYQCDTTAKQAQINLTEWIQSVSPGPMPRLAYPTSEMLDSFNDTLYDSETLDLFHGSTLDEKNSGGHNDASRTFLLQSIVVWSALLLYILIRCITKGTGMSKIHRGSKLVRKASKIRS
jgi:hypothetical protein